MQCNQCCAHAFPTLTTTSLLELPLQMSTMFSISHPDSGPVFKIAVLLQRAFVSPCFFPAPLLYQPHPSPEVLCAVTIISSHTGPSAPEQSDQNLDPLHELCLHSWRRWENKHKKELYLKKLCVRGQKNILILGISDKLAISILWLVEIVSTNEMCWSLLARCSTPAWAVRRVFKSQSSRSLAASHSCCLVCRCCSDSCRACWSLMKQRKSRGFRTIFIHIHIICPH